MKANDRRERRRSLRETYNNQKRKTSGTKPYGPRSAFTASVCDQTSGGARCEPPDSRPGRSPSASLALRIGPARPAPTTRVEGYASREVEARAPASLARRRQLRSRENQSRSHTAPPPLDDRSRLLGPAVHDFCRAGLGCLVAGLEPQPRFPRRGARQPPTARKAGAALERHPDTIG